MKFIFKYPDKKKFLIFDGAGSEVFKGYLNPKEYSILHRRNESINIPILLKSLFRFDLDCKLSEKYFLTYLEHVKPKLLLTLIENNPIFYSLKSKYFKFKKAFVQNGNGFIETIKNFNLNKNKNMVDYMFVFNKDYGRIFSKYIKGKPIVIGSFKNNHKQIIKKKKKNNKILFISQWREHEKNINPYYKSGEKLIIFLNNYCFKNKKELIIAGAFNEKTREKNFYVGALKRQKNICKFKFIPKKETYSNYHLLDKSEIIITIDSAFGHEAFARGCKVIFFNFRSKLNGLKYGWPGKFKNEGLFWLNNYNEKKLQSKINILFKLHHKDWKKRKKKLTHQQIFYDRGNTIFTKIIKKI